MEATLLSSLHTKLDDLEGRLQAYRYDLISDFQRYYHDLLTGVNPSVATSIQQAIAPSFANYPILRPELEVADSQPQPPPPDRPQPATFQQPATPEASPRIEAPNGSHDRETDLQGLFTPSYLPLLDSSPPYNRPAVPATTPTTTSIQATDPFPLLPAAMDTPPVDNSTATENGVTMDSLATQGNSAAPAGGQAPSEANRLVRTATEESTSSAASDKSDSKVMRSAMRRSSSISKPPQSPRRVRFEFMGAEVLPTSSPQQVKFIAPNPMSPAADDEPIASDMILDDDINEWQPPRKSSSTEALRALSRAPAEEGTVWTVVDPDADRANSHPDTRNKEASKKSSSMEQTKSTMNNPRIEVSPGAAQSENTTSSEPSAANGRRSDTNKNTDGSSDDEADYLAMGKRKSAVKQKSTSPPDTQLPLRGASNETSPTAPGSNKLHPNVNNASRETRSPAIMDNESFDDYGDDDDLFEFEPAGLSAPPKPREKPAAPPPDESSDDDDDEFEDEMPTMAQSTQQPLYSTSPAVSIARPQRTENAMASVSRFQPGSLGSYKGRPVVMPVVRNPEVHARAASLGQFNTFVGGLDGRSGMDEGDLSSFRASVVQPGFAGTPRSFTERFMMEEAQEERRRNGATR
ncbi:hypothetical protein TGAM01_v203044 [Trichoderma gamsii]|uniref:Uncharacterized protein n=1 Tax=Trichoderma gamsii TaxID=398673 RepID=A0A0W7VY44_9HYPO|nr:hypothetical protein TGAM01_v203044 [Trichoderma gamsii]PNP47672.1 hypothetical protein TGAMA5MH_01495 [Trichoderma gamsii]PON27907.1 hypothetical protein TGAM01_v203044 [Trichoderma gamsii]